MAVPMKGLAAYGEICCNQISRLEEKETRGKTVKSKAPEFNLLHTVGLYWS
jgi:hypothetical protein